MRVAALVAAAACAVGQCAAQCTLPATLPPNTVLATTNPGECVLGGEIADGSECENAAPGVDPPPTTDSTS